MTPQELNNKRVRDTFLNYQSNYEKQYGDRYVASQFAAIATEQDYNISKDKLVKILNGE